MSAAEAAELIELSFVAWTRVGPGDHVLDRGSDRPGLRAVFGGGERSMRPGAAVTVVVCLEIWCSC